MSSPRRASFGEVLHESLREDPYLQEIYSNLLHNYALGVFGLTGAEKRPVDLRDALAFADLLAKAIPTDGTEDDKTWAQEIIALINASSSDSKPLQYFTGIVLSSNG